MAVANTVGMPAAAATLTPEGSWKLRSAATVTRLPNASLAAATTMSPTQNHVTTALAKACETKKEALLSSANSRERNRRTSG